MKYILGQKIGMTQYIDQNGEAFGVTVLEVGPCPVTVIRQNDETLKSVQIGFGATLNNNKPKAGHLKTKQVKHLREFHLDATNESIYQPDGTVDVSIFDQAGTVSVTGISKGKGFQGCVKRHNFKIGPKTHGSKNHRKPGSIGSRYPQGVIKGRRLPGRMGNDQITVKNLKIVEIDTVRNMLIVKGSIPGQKGRLLIIRQS
jgi:large subunit ribosomal protein L3